MVTKLEANNLRICSTHDRQYDGSIIVPKLMHNPHAGYDAKEEED